MKKKKGNLLLLLIKILFLFLVTDFIVSNVPALMTRAVNTGKYGLSFIVEMFAALVVFIVMLLSKNQYVFTAKKENFFKSIILGLPLLVIAVLMFILNMPSIFDPSLNLSNIITLALFCLCIGLYEEFLCRGWLLNEFLEKYGSTRKQVITSIIISAVIFGIMHISNIWVGGQTVVETVLQICQATAIGILFGGIYYRTKNIWAVVFLHGFYDFAIMLGSVNALKDCHTVTETITLSLILGTVMLVAIYLLSSAIILRKSKINHLIENEPTLTDQEKDKSEKLKIIYLVLIVVMITMPSPTTETETGEEICYEYEEKSLPQTETHYANYSDYEFEETKKVQEVVVTPSELDPTITVENIVEKEVITKIKLVAEEKKLILVINDKKVEKKFEHPIEILVLEQPNHYLVFVHEQNQTSGASKVYYSRYLEKDSIEDTQEYIDEFNKSFKEEMVPDVRNLGYITSREFEYKYPIIDVGPSKYLYLDENDKLILIK